MMKYKIVAGIMLSGFVSAVHAEVTLKEAFEAARKNMETLKRSDAIIEQSKELKTQARAAVLPNISGVGAYTRIDRPEGGGPSQFLLTKQYSAALRLTQPIIEGGALAAYGLADENLLLSKFQKDATEINLYQLVISSFYNLQIAQVDVTNLEEFKRFSSQRVKELKDRTRIGRSRKGELVEAEAQLLSAESQYKQGLINLKQSEEIFEFYTKLKPENISPLGELPVLTSSMESYLAKVRNRPDIRATTQEVKVAEKRVDIAKGGHYPSVNLTSNYYFDRTGVLASSEWDVGLAVVIPIYQGGGVSAQVRESVEGKRIAELNRSETVRTAERDVMISYRSLVEVQEQLKYVKAAMKRFEEAYDLNKRDYQNGLVTNLDVLQSLSYYIESKRAYTSILARAHMTYKNLEAQIGVLP